MKRLHQSTVRIRPALLLALCLTFLLPVMASARSENQTSSDRMPVEWRADVHSATELEVKFIDGSDIRLQFEHVLSAQTQQAHLDLLQSELEAQYAEEAAARFQKGHLDTDSSSQQIELDLLQLTQQLPTGSWSHTFSLPKSDLDALQEEAATRILQQGLSDLNLYFRYTVPEGMHPTEAMEIIAAFDIVETVYPVQLPVAPPLPPDYTEANDGNVDSAFGNMYQRYLDAAPDGIDARYAYSDLNNGRGNGIKICDVEYGYFDHLDLPDINYVGPPFDDSLGDLFYDHGTAVLGILGAKDNGWGITGIVPEADIYFASTYIDGRLNIADAITRCANELDKGDVILIEQQASGPGGACQNGGSNPANCVPVEWVQSNYAAIQAAVGKGIIVIQAAGNGNEDLDDPIYDAGHKPFQAVNDSGAFIIGSANTAWSPNQNERRNSSTFGDTVDFFAWGSNMIAPGYGIYYDDDGDNLNYTLFGGTSGASPMVAAAAAIMQASYTAENGAPANPGTIKSLMTSTGTPQVNENGENIGVMPNLRAGLEEIWGDAPAPPVITPGSGTYSMPMQVTIDYGDNSQSNSNTHIRYTLNGSEPTFDSFIFIPEQGDTLYLNYGVTIKAKAFQSTGAGSLVLESETAEVTYVSSTPKVDTPVITPNGGTYNQGTQVVLSTTTPGATIRYRTDGRSISFFYPGIEYTGPITLPPGTHEISARAYKDGYYKSDIAYADDIVINEIILPNPTIYPNSDQYYGEVNVYIGSTVLGADIRYTTDGSDPTASSERYDQPFTLTEDTTVKARIYLDGYTKSDVVTVNYQVLAVPDTPTIAPNSGTTHNSLVQVTLGAPTPGSFIRYTTNGAEPTGYSTLYSGPFTLGPGQHTVKAKAYSAEFNGTASSTSTATYTVFDSGDQVAVPKIDPRSGVFNGPLTIEFSSDTEDAEIYYTVNGLAGEQDPGFPNPIPTAIKYNGPFQLVDGTYNIRARAYKSGVGTGYSEQLTNVSFTVVTPLDRTVNDPTISPPSGTYTNAIDIDIEAPDFSSPFNIRALFVTQDGTDPNIGLLDNRVGSGGTYSINNLDEPTTVKAGSGQAGWKDSQIISAEYTFKCDTPAISSGGTYTSSALVDISSGTQNADIYYTLDGSEPDETDIGYTQPFTLPVGEYAVRAICYRDDFDPSEVATEAFLVNQAPTVPVITTQPENTTGNKCGAASLSVVAVGMPDPSYQWYKDGLIVGGENEPTLELPLLSLADSGSYTVTVQNSAGEAVSNPAIVTVTDTGETCFDQPPTITTQPVSQTVDRCGSVTFSVVAEGTAPFSYQWFKDDIALPGEMGSSLSLSSVEPDDAGSFTVAVSNAAGSVTSNPASLTVNDTGAICNPEPPIITTQPLSQTVDKCSSVTFSVSATGTAPLSYQWSKDGSEIGGQNGPELTLSDLETDAAGSYTVTISNVAGSVTSNPAILTINETGATCTPVAPEIVQQPVGTTVDRCQPFSLSVVASGSAPFSYQWAKDGTDISDATFASLSVSEAEMTDAGSYTVTISNSVGSITSSPALVAVNETGEACDITPPVADEELIFMPMITNP